MPIEETIFENCHTINGLLECGNDNAAREELIELLDLHYGNDIPYAQLVSVCL